MAKGTKLSRREFLYTTTTATTALLLHGMARKALAGPFNNSVSLQGSEESKPVVRVSTLGQFGHGKTTLTAAITKVLALNGQAEAQDYANLDNSAEEKARGITMNIRYVEYETDGRLYVHVDCPRHHDYVKNMITGAAEIDGAILVVSALDGVMPETREQVRLAKIIGAPAIVVFLNKMDLVDDEELVSLVEQDVVDLLDEHGYARSDTPIIRGSALEALESDADDWNAAEYAPIWSLLQAMRGSIPVSIPDVERPFLMPVEDVFSIKGRGTIVTGRVEHGVLRKEDEIEIIGLGHEVVKTAVGGIEMFHKETDTIMPGDNAGILLQGIAREDVERGQVLAQPGSITAHDHFMSEVYILSKDEGGRHNAFFDGYRPQFYIRTVDVTGTITLPESIEMVMPGDNTSVEVELIAPMALKHGSRFAIRESGLTVGAGIVTNILE